MESPESAPPIHLDIKALQDVDLQPEQCMSNALRMLRCTDRYVDVTDLLSHASAQEIEGYQTDLRKLKHQTSADLQQSVYQNRTQFIKISKEAEKLKGEIDTLRELMSELTGALGQANGNAANGVRSPLNGERAARRHANRSSVANLESMWNVQLQALWKNVERSQKFLPAIPGRHIVLETPQWVELDSATWKPKRPVHIVLLNDHLLVASKKRKKMDPNSAHQGPAPTKLVAEECWPLQDIDLIDLGANLAQGGADGMIDERNVGTAVNIRAANKSFTYRHDQRNKAAKDELLLTFRRTAEELRKSVKAEIGDKENGPNEALHHFAARNLAPGEKPEIIETINTSSEKPEILIEVDGKQQNLRWVEGQIDDLDIDIALQNFELAVTKIERLRKVASGLLNHTIAQELISFKIDERASRLGATLVRALIDTPSFLEATKSHTSWLARLGLEDRAREAFLQARTDILVKRARQCVFEGDLHKYVFQVSYIYTTIVKNTATIYQACFAPIAMSACIKWAKGHLEQLNVTLVRQLSSVERGGTIWQECLELVWEHEASLKQVGLDFLEVIAKDLGGKPASKRPKSQTDKPIGLGLR